MKMTDLALGGKCGFLGASGLRNGSAAAARPKNPSAESRPVSATAPKPAPVSQRNSRRVRRQNWQASFMVTPLHPSFTFLVPTLRVGTSSYDALRRGPLPRSEPIGRHRNQSRQPRIIPRTRIPPVRRLINVPALHRVIVDVLQLLLHHHVALNHFRMTALLPELVRAVELMPVLPLLQLLKDRLRPPGFQ